MTLNFIADPCCNQVDNIEPDLTCWREPAYTVDGTTTPSKVYVHIKGDVDVAGSPAYISGEVLSEEYPEWLRSGDVNGVKIWMDDNELGSTMNIAFTEAQDIDLIVPDGEECESIIGHIQLTATLYEGTWYPTLKIGNVTCYGGMV